MWTEAGHTSRRTAKTAGMHAMRRDSLSMVPSATVLAKEKPTHGLPEMTRTDCKDGNAENSSRRRRRLTAFMAEPTTSMSWEAGDEGTEVGTQSGPR